MKKIIIILICAIILCGCDKEEDVKKKEDTGVNVNTKEDIIKDQTVGDFEFTNTSMIEENGLTTITTSIKNNSNVAKNVPIFTIVVKDRGGSVIEETIGYVGGEIKAGETKQVTTSITSSLADAYSIEYKINQ